MQRRDFLKLAAMTGLSLGLPMTTRRVLAEGEGYPGPFYVLINASGGWDPRFLFDPSLDEAQNRLYTDTGKIGNISYAKIPVDLDRMGLSSDYGYDSILLDNETFLERHGSRITVINGVDMRTNNHDAGSRAIWSGQLQEGYPTIGALIAAARAGDRPMAFLSAGGYDATEGIVPLTRVGSAADMQKLAFPNRVDPTNPESRDLYHAGDTESRILRAQEARLARLKEQENLPRLRKSQAELELARVRAPELKSLVIPEELVTIEGYQLGGLQNNMRQAQIAIAAFQAGLAACVNLSIGGFDTHGNHDRDQSSRLAQLLALVDFVVQTLDGAGLLARTTIFVGSDFARGPFYNGPNANHGKDHWPISSFFALGAGVKGNRVIGGTTGDQRARQVDEASLEVVDSGGVSLTFEHIHLAARRLSGVEAQSDDFPLKGAKLPLFG